MNNIHPKVAAGGLAGAVVGIILTVAEQFGAKVDAGLAVDLTTVLAFAMGWFWPSLDTSTPVQK